MDIIGKINRQPLSGIPDLPPGLYVVNSSVFEDQPQGHQAHHGRYLLGAVTVAASAAVIITVGFNDGSPHHSIGNAHIPKPARVVQVPNIALPNTSRVTAELSAKVQEVEKLPSTVLFTRKHVIHHYPTHHNVVHTPKKPVHHSTVIKPVSLIATPVLSGETVGYAAQAVIQTKREDSSRLEREVKNIESQPKNRRAFMANFELNGGTTLYVKLGSHGNKLLFMEDLHKILAAVPAQVAPAPVYTAQAPVVVSSTSKRIHKLVQSQPTYVHLPKDLNKYKQTIPLNGGTPVPKKHHFPTGGATVGTVK